MITADSDDGHDPSAAFAGPRGSEDGSTMSADAGKPAGSPKVAGRTMKQDCASESEGDDFQDANEMASPKEPPSSFDPKPKRAGVQNAGVEPAQKQSPRLSTEPFPEPPTSPKERVVAAVAGTRLSKAHTPDQKPLDERKDGEKVTDVEKPRKALPEDVSTGQVGVEAEKGDASGAAKSAKNTSTKASPALGAGPFAKVVSEWSHQRTASGEPKQEDNDDGEWQEMPSYAPYDIYDDENKLVAREMHESDVEVDAYAGLGGAGRGYTRVQLDEDAQSATSMDENTQYLFQGAKTGTTSAEMEDEEERNAVSQMQATKDLLTEGQRIAYVGITRIITSKMLAEAVAIPTTRKSKKALNHAAESMTLWSQKMMVRLYAHMEISAAEQIMIEQLAEHGVLPADLSPTLMQNARVNNPMAEKKQQDDTLATAGDADLTSRTKASPPSAEDKEDNDQTVSPPPPYEPSDQQDMPAVRTPSQLPTSSKLDIDLRWTLLCDLFLTLIADSIYDARSRVLLERIGAALGIDWIDICRFEKRVTDALEMQQQAEKENWNEDEHKETRRKAALTKRYVVMGLATVGGGLVIGLSAGLLAPVIGAGLAAGFSTIGIAGTSGFLAGAGGAAIITTGAATSGGIIAVRAAGRRTGAVKTFEYRPLHNNKRVNLIVTVSGWMTGKEDDVRLPYSTVDPLMGDIYSVLWEPEMLRSMGDTINILATEALTQGLQQVLGSTILIGLMAALQLPIVLSKLAYLIDNPWTNSLERAQSAGLILADSLIDRNLGTRPITFVGYSLGCRMIFACLQELARRGATGLVQNVYLFGSPIVANQDEYLKVRSVVSGRFVNGYATNDWILGYLFRMTSGGISRVAGLAPVEGIPGLENINVTEFVPGHMSYRAAMPRLLREVGWIVTSDEFTEIEDPDPENHSTRHRQLINEIEEARLEYEKKQKEKEAKGRFGFLQRKKKEVVSKQAWETYDVSAEQPSTKKDKPEADQSVLFDIEAIRAELAAEQMEVKELPSTLPPMKLNIDRSSRSVSQPLQPSRSALRVSQSYSTPVPAKASELRSMSSSPRHASSGSLAAHYSPHESSEDMTMSFETPDLAHRSQPTPNHLNSPAVYPHSTPASYSTTPPTTRGGLTPQARSTSGDRHDSWTPRPAASMPHATSTNTYKAPATMNGLPLPDLEHNAWADDDDMHSHGDKEGEVSMTFA